MTTIAIFSTYAPSEGFGGPARIYHQRTTLEAAGHTVDHVVLHSDPRRGDVRPTDFVALSERPERALFDQIYADVELGERTAADSQLVQRVAGHLRDRRTELIILEQPFLVGLVEDVAHRIGADIIYSCQNIEYRLRRDLERFQPLRLRAADRWKDVRDLEARAVGVASSVTAICPTDQQQLESEFGCRSVLVPNGTSIASIGAPAAPLPSGVRHFSFAGSAYWPNVEGFVDIATPSLAFLPPDVRIHVAGSVGGPILTHRDILRCESVNRHRILHRGFLPMEDLAETMRRSTAILVPIFIGEGSNLKSADALAAGAPVIMTKRATHGYEDVLADDSEGVVVVETAAEFRQAMRERITEDSTSSHRVGSRRAQSLSWATRLRPLVQLIA